MNTQVFKKEATSFRTWHWRALVLLLAFAILLVAVIAFKSSGSALMLKRWLEVPAPDPAQPRSPNALALRQAEQEEISAVRADMASERQKLARMQAQLEHEIESIHTRLEAPAPHGELRSLLLFNPVDAALKDALQLDDERWAKIQTADNAARAENRALMEQLKQNTLAPTELAQQMARVGAARDEIICKILSPEEWAQFRTFIKENDKKRQAELSQNVQAQMRPPGSSPEPAPVKPPQSPPDF